MPTKSTLQRQETLVQRPSQSGTAPSAPRRKRGPLCAFPPPSARNPPDGTRSQEASGCSKETGHGGDEAVRPLERMVRRAGSKPPRHHADLRPRSARRRARPENLTAVDQWTKKKALRGDRTRLAGTQWHACLTIAENNLEVGEIYIDRNALERVPSRPTCHKTASAISVFEACMHSQRGVKT